MITEEIKEQIKEMYYKGRTKTDISDILGVSISTIGNILKHNNKITDIQKQEIKELYKQGLNKTQIARKLEVSLRSVHRTIKNKQYTYRIPKRTSEEIRREREERNRRLKDSIKEEEVVYPTELDKCLAEIYKSDNDINYKQHKYCRKMPLSLDSVEAGVDTLIDILQQLKQDKDYSDINVVNTDKLEFFGEVLLTNEEYKEMLLEKIEQAKYRIKIEQEKLNRNNMNPIKYETALLLREKMLSHNFSIYGEYAYCLNTNELVRYIHNNTFAVADKNIFYPDNDKHYFTPAPLQEEVIEWLWNKHKIFIEIYIKKNGVICTSYDAKVSIKYFNQGVFSKIELKENFDNRNEAMEQGIIEALKLIKNK